MDDWLFADAPNAMAVTMRQVVHDAEDGDWQFLTGGEFHVADGMLVTLESIVRRDFSIAALADLPLGWQAWRESLGAL